MWWKKTIYGEDNTPTLYFLYVCSFATSDKKKIRTIFMILGKN